MKDDNVWREQISEINLNHYRIVGHFISLEQKKMFYNIDAWR